MGEIMMRKTQGGILKVARDLRKVLSDAGIETTHRIWENLGWHVEFRNEWVCLSPYENHGHVTWSCNLVVDGERLNEYSTQTVGVSYRNPHDAINRVYELVKAKSDLWESRRAHLLNGIGEMGIPNT